MTRTRGQSPTKFRILLVVAEFMYGSTVRWLCNLVRGLDQGRFEIQIAANDLGDEASDQVEALGVPIHLFRPFPPRKPDLNYLWDFVRSPALVRRGRFDLVHSFCYQSPFTEPLIFKAFSPQTKFIFTKSNLQWTNHAVNWRLRCKLSDLILCESRTVHDLLVDKGFGKKTKCIMSGVDTESFRKDSAAGRAFRETHDIPIDAIVFGCVAQYIEIKEHITLLRAFEMLGDKFPTVHLVLCGPDHSDDYYKRVVECVAASSSSRRIRMIGTQSEMVPVYSAVDCLILPSRFEAFGNVLIEAMACARPTIACRIGGPLDIIDEHKTGLFCRVSDAVNLAAQLQWYLDHPKLLHDHGVQARERVMAMFSVDAMVAAHTKAYLDLLEETKS